MDKNIGILPINGTCHFPMIENPNESNRLLQAILIKIERSNG
jgi:hypothetical protein